jgi:hypothetical protein
MASGQGADAVVARRALLLEETRDASEGIEWEAYHAMNRTSKIVGVL